MIAPLRRRHRLMFFLLTPALAVLVMLAISDRPDIPSSSLPENLQTVAVGEASPAAFTGLEAQIARSGTELSLTMESPLRAPDVLAYHSAQAAGAGDSLPTDARLLGTVSHERVNVYQLPSGETGHLLLYSLGHQTMVDSTPLQAAGGAR